MQAVCLYLTPRGAYQIDDASTDNAEEPAMDRETSVFLPSSLLVNIDEIDEQHAALFSKLASLKKHCVDANTFQADEARELMALLVTHCATEERLAGEAGLDFAAHASKHRKMLAAITKAMDEVREEHMDVFSVLRYIEYWFERHIREEDQRFASLLEGRPGVPMHLGSSVAQHALPV